MHNDKAILETSLDKNFDIKHASKFFKIRLKILIVWAAQREILSPIFAERLIQILHLAGV